jgi:hypothetical protein
LDIAKNVFQVHGVDSQGQTVLRRKVRRDQLLKLFDLLVRQRTAQVSAMRGHLAE